MNSIAPPKFSLKEVFELCRSSSNEELKVRLDSVFPYMDSTSREYTILAEKSEMYMIKPSTLKDYQVVSGGVTKKELKDLYSTEMVRKNKPAREIYDKLLSSASHGRCPFCGLGRASTLDHFLPKFKFPILSITPNNLVPSCRDCNTGKNTSTAVSAGSQCFHPYFDKNFMDLEQWVFAKVESISFGIVNFFVNPPAHWDEVSKRRVDSHFKEFDLAARYAIEAAEEITCRSQILRDFEEDFNYKGLADLFFRDYKSSSKSRVNSWKTAFYQAMYKYYDSLSIKIRPKYISCPVCEGEAVLVNYPCPACDGNGSVKEGSRINLDDFNMLKCPECDGRSRCSLCAGSEMVDRDTILELTRNRP